ncbi:MAG: FtsX-like permease family protein [Burkholderiales bacterium]
MGVVRLAFAYARRRPLSTLLVVALLAIGVATVTLTLLVARELEDRLTRDAAGIDLVVGAKGSPLQLVLAGVYQVDVPPGNIPLAAIAQLRARPQVGSVIPLSLGDSFRGYRIVGTEPAYVEHFGGALRDGKLWAKPLEAVLGSDVARATGLLVGATFAGSHGLAEGGGEHADAPYRVTGVLAPTGTVLDRLVVTSLESVWDVHDAHHAQGHADDDEKREVTLALVRFATPLAASGLAREINAGTAQVAASPALEIARLLAVFGVGFEVVRAFAVLLMAASALMLFVALAQALEDRRYDLAILRTLGASRGQVAQVLLVESLALVAAGTVAGLALAHGAAWCLGAWVPQAAPLSGAALRWLPEEWGVAGLALAAGILAALWPAWRASRLDVAATLADG